jgi:hypothetical protein
MCLRKLGEFEVEIGTRRDLNSLKNALSGSASALDDFIFNILLHCHKR